MRDSKVSHSKKLEKCDTLGTVTQQVLFLDKTKRKKVGHFGPQSLGSWTVFSKIFLKILKTNRIKTIITFFRKKLLEKKTELDDGHFGQSRIFVKIFLIEEINYFLNK